ncbi:LOW QUALITY PROTEIN: parathyroid hormone 1a [Brachyistius frenatus]|uniref:LOW QUALITY PROTEIN: parathyroid hormone 1a n=1 Tax=Brachyistius frenatus TaxID=100188 RepID=UPI0037E96723
MILTLSHFLLSQVIKVNMQQMDYKLLFISLCVLHLSIHCKGRPIRKRTVSEVQLMHNLGEHKQVLERREWLQMRLRGIHTAAAWDGSGGPEAATEGRSRRRLRPEDLPEMGDLTPEEIQHALNYLEKLFKSKQS